MKGAFELLLLLEREGIHDSFGRFTLDSAKAREKMRRFQLEDPHMYVLELFQSALASGATRVTAYCDSDDFKMDFDGTPFPREELENIFSSLFVSQQNFALERFRELALALNCAAGFCPAFIRVDSGDGTSGWRMSITSSHELTESLPEAVMGTRIWVKDRVSWRMMKRFLSGLKGLPIEAKILKDRCSHAPVPVEVNGSPINEPHNLDGYPWKREFAYPECSGTLCFTASLLQDSIVHIERFGVSLVTHTEKLPSIQCEAFLRWDRCIKNVSQSDVVKDKSYVRILAILHKEAENLLEEMAKSFKDERDPAKAAIGKRYFLEYVRRELRCDLYSSRVKKLKRVVAALPLFSMTDGSSASLEELIDQQKHIGFTPVLAVPPNTGELPAGIRIVRADQDMHEILSAVFNGKIRDMAAELEKEARRKRKRIYWERRSCPPVISTPCLLKLPFSSPPFEGETGVSKDGTMHTTVIFTRERMFLGTRKYLLTGLSIEAVVNCDSFTPTEAWEDIEEDHIFRDGLRNVCKAAQTMLEELPALFSADAPDPQIRRMLLALLHAGVRAPKKVGSTPLTELIEETLDRLDCSTEFPIIISPSLKTKLDNLPLFETAGGVFLSLKALRKPLGRVRVCDGLELAILKKALGTKRVELIDALAAPSKGEGIAGTERSAFHEKLQRSAGAPSAELVIEAREGSVASAAQDLQIKAETAAPVTGPAGKMPPKWQEILEEVKKTFQTLRISGDPSITDALIRKIRFSRIETNLPVSHDTTTGVTTINPSHRAVLHIVDTFTSSPTMKLFLVSAIYSAINRAYNHITDDSEISFQMGLLKLIP